MNREKKSFFERLTGTINMAASDDVEEVVHTKVGKKETKQEKENWIEEDTSVGELAVDVYQTPENIFIKTMVAGVKPEDLDVAITRDMVTITGRREESRTAGDDDYFLKELYWGEFSRTILLPSRGCRPHSPPPRTMGRVGLSLRNQGTIHPPWIQNSFDCRRFRCDPHPRSFEPSREK